MSGFFRVDYPRRHIRRIEYLFLELGVTGDHFPGLLPSPYLPGKQLRYQLKDGQQHPASHTNDNALQQHINVHKQPPCCSRGKSISQPGRPLPRNRARTPAGRGFSRADQPRRSAPQSRVAGAGHPNPVRLRHYIVNRRLAAVSYRASSQTSGSCRCAGGGATRMRTCSVGVGASPLGCSRNSHERLSYAAGRLRPVKITAQTVAAGHTDRSTRPGRPGRRRLPYAARRRRAANQTPPWPRPSTSVRQDPGRGGPALGPALGDHCPT